MVRNILIGDVRSYIHLPAFIDSVVLPSVCVQSPNLLDYDLRSSKRNDHKVLRSLCISTYYRITLLTALW